MAHSNKYNQGKNKRKIRSKHTNIQRAKKTYVLNHVEETPVTRLGFAGDGTVLVQDKPVHVPFTLPGDVISVDVEGPRGRMTKLLQASPDRQAALCPHFGDTGGRCGGCALQHMATKPYLAWKQKVIEAALAREGLGGVLIKVPLASPLGTRRRAGFSMRRQGGKIIVGFVEKNSHRLVPLSACPVLDPALFAGRSQLIKLAKPLFDRSPDLVLTAHITLCDTGLDIDLAGAVDEATLVLSEREAMLEAARVESIIRVTINQVPFYASRQAVVHLAGVPVALPSRAFLQASKWGEQALQKLVCEGVSNARHVADLFSGCGTFSLAMAARAKVLAVEEDAACVAALEQAVPLPGTSQVQTQCRDLERQPLMVPELEKFEVVIFDPPRAGAKAQAAQLAQSSVPKVIGVSCNPKTFAADAALLCAGGYELAFVQPVDQFLFSPHIELVGVFRRP